MRLHEIEELPVAGRPAELDRRLGMSTEQAAPLLEDPVLLGMDQLTHVDVGRQGVGGTKWL